MRRGVSNRHNTSNEFGKISSKATSILTLKLIQTCVLKENQEPLVLQSKLSFYDLPGSEILVDDPETIRIK
jgi:hypothetical protein